MAAPDGFRRVRALSARTQFVPGHGQVHFDPDSSKFETRNPALPEDLIKLFVDRDWVADDLEEAEIAANEAANSKNASTARRRGGRRKADPDSDQAPAS